MMRLVKPAILLLGVLLGAGAALSGEADLSKVMGAISPGLGANDLSDIIWDGRTMWISGSGTLNRHVSNFDTVYDWQTYRQLPGFGQGSIFAMASSGNLIVTSWGWYEDVQDQSIPFSGGFSVSRDRGESWTHVPVVSIFPDRAEWKRPEALIATWDFAISEGTIWASTLTAFLLRSDDAGQTWSVVLPDEGPLDYANPKLNYFGQCVDAYGDTVWVGTFQGINLSTDRGSTWKNFSWKSDEQIDLNNPKPGNFVYAVEHKVVNGKTHVWAGGAPYSGNDGYYGIYHTDDNGATWQIKSTNYNAWNFAFGHAGASDPAVSDSTVFAASDSGLAVSHDLGETWDIMDIRETDLLKWNRGERVAAVAVVADTLWATSSNGIARTTDWGKTWEIFKGMVRVPTLDEGKTNVGVSSNLDGVETYPYPNPFSPSRSNADYSRTRIHYALTSAARVSVSIYGYNGRKLRDLVIDASRAGGREYDEVWDGRDESGNVAPNGVYFYMIKTDKGDMARGKIVVLD